MHIKFIQQLIDVIRCKKKLQNKEVQDIHKNYSLIKTNLVKKINQGEKIRVCFSVIFDSIFPAKSIFEKMLQDELFDPFILVIPDSARGEENMLYQMNKTYKTLSSQYKQVYNSYYYNKKIFIDFSSKIDICFFANPYDEMTESFYKIKQTSKLGILCFYTSYGYVISNWHYSLYDNPSFNSLFKIYALESFEYKKLNNKLTVPDSAKLAGYCKMDKLANIKNKERKRKKVIIAPHHTINKEGLSLSNFLEYFNFFLELPRKYTELDFIFRPHPLLFTTLEGNRIWDKEKIEEYIEEIKSNPNMKYEEEGDYLETFVNSDGLIHDCGSFSAEYLFTGHPCCYLLKDDETTTKNSNEFHQACINQHYKAYNKQQIIDFIENIIIKENDWMKTKRKNFFETILKINYPNTTDFIYNDIKKELGID